MSCDGVPALSLGMQWVSVLSTMSGLVSELSVTLPQSVYLTEDKSLISICVTAVILQRFDFVLRWCQRPYEVVGCRASHLVAESNRKVGSFK